MPTATAPPRRTSLAGGTKIAAYVGLALLVGALLQFAWRPTPLALRLELPLTDFRTRLAAGRRAPDPRIVIASVSDADVDKVKGKLVAGWPWPLTFNAVVMDVLHRAGAKVVVVDVLHLDRGAGEDDVVGGRERTEAEKQQALGEASDAEEYQGKLRDLGAAVVAMRLTSTSPYEIPARVAAATQRLGSAGLIPPPKAHGWDQADLPVRRVVDGATVLAFANAPPGVDGIVRRVPTSARWGGRPVRSLAVAAAELVLGAPARYEGDELRFGDVTRPVDPDGSFLLDFRGAPDHTYARVAPSTILVEWAQALDKTGTVPPEARAALEGKIVVWGVNLSGADDLLPTPLGGGYPGPELVATSIDDLLNGGGRVRAGRTENALILLLAVGLVGLAGGAMRSRGAAALAALLALVATGGWGWWAFLSGRVTDVLTPFLGILLAWGAVTAARLLTEGRYNRWLEGAFGRYLAPSLIEALKKDPSMLELGGTTRQLTILFSDVKGFTTLSEQLKPPQLVRLLNEYLTAHCDAVFRHGGVVDKFIGDAVMAFYGDPVPDAEHALHACRTALDVQRDLASLQALLTELGVKEFIVRIGLNSGDAVVGNMGSRHRFDYTCMGDTVNLASRLESANKFFGTRILLGPLTYEAAKAGILAKPLARVAVKGKTEPVPVYELLGLVDAEAGLQAHVAAFERAHGAARAGDLVAARAALAEAARLRPGDGPCAWFGGILDEIASGEEPSPWSGVIVLTEK